MNFADMKKGGGKKTSGISVEFGMKLDILQHTVLLRFVFSPPSSPEKGMSRHMDKHELFCAYSRSQFVNVGCT